MADANVRASDPRNNQLSGNVSAWFKPRGATRFVDLGNVNKAQFTPNETTLPHMSNRRGVRAKDLELITERAGKLDFGLDEMNVPNLGFAFGTSATPDADTVDLDENKNAKNLGAGVAITLGWTDITPGSVVVQNINHEDEVTYVEGVDYDVNYSAGTVTPKVGGALENTDPDTGVPEIHIAWQKNVEGQSFEIFPGKTINGEAKIQVLTEDGIKYAAIWKNANLKNNGAINIGDGSSYAEFPLTIETLEDSDGKIGKVVVVNADELP